MIRLTYQQHRRVCGMVHQCCNYDDGSCLPLEDVCPQSISYSLNCKWFRAAVLPTDVELFAALYPPPDNHEHHCKECGKLFHAPKPNTLYCPVCAVERVRQSKREWARRKRDGM